MVISSDAASLPEVLGKAASYFRLGDKQELKEKMRLGIRQKTPDVAVEEIQKQIGKFQWAASARKIAKELVK